MPGLVPDVAIRLSKTKIVLIIVGALVFVAMGALLWSIADQYADALAVECAAIAGILFGTVAAGYGCVKLFDDRPGLVIDGDGLIDQSSAVAAGRIPWSEIVGITVHSIGGQRFLTIAVRDPQKYIARGGRLRQMLNAANAKLSGSPINISANALRIRFDELERIVTDAFRDRRL